MKALLDWAEGYGGPGLDEISHQLTQIEQSQTPQFEAYLEALVTTYQHWWTHYTLTDATGKLDPPQPEQPPIFDFGLMVQTVAQPQTTDDPDANPNPQKQAKAERLPVLNGIRKYADDHVLLVGRPGSGKSTALIRLLLEEAMACLPQSGSSDARNTTANEDSFDAIPPAPLEKGGVAFKVPPF